VSYDLLIMLMILAAVVSTNLMPLLYWIGARWWKTVEGQAIMISTTGLALLIDLSLAARVFDLSDRILNPLRVGIFAVIIVGSYWMLAALIRRQYLRHK